MVIRTSFLFFPCHDRALHFCSGKPGYLTSFARTFWQRTMVEPSDSSGGISLPIHVNTIIFWPAYRRLLQLTLEGIIARTYQLLIQLTLLLEHRRSEHRRRASLSPKPSTAFKNGPWSESVGSSWDRVGSSLNRRLFFAEKSPSSKSPCKERLRPSTTVVLPATLIVEIGKEGNVCVTYISSLTDFQLWPRCYARFGAPSRVSLKLLAHDLFDK